MVDRLILSANAVLESTVARGPSRSTEDRRASCRWSTRRRDRAAISSTARSATFRSLQFVEALTLSKDDWLGQHVFKAGVDLQHSRFDGDNYSQEVDVVRLDGSLAERTTYTPPLTNPEVSGTEVALFVQDRWRVNDRLNFELGFRADFDDVVEPRQLFAARRACR